MSDIEEKQEYLRDAILDKGYDGNQFMTFLQTKRGEEINLDEWTLDELKTAVSEFIVKLEEGNKPSEPIQGTNASGAPVEESKPEQAPVVGMPESQQPQSPVNQQQPVSSPAPNAPQANIPQQQVEKKSSVYNEMRESLPCHMSKKTQFSEHPNPSVSLSLPEKIEGGIFSKSYVTYLVEAVPLGTKVRKRYSDFEWLREMMQKIYLGSVIPPIPRKNYGDRFNETFISKRMRGLERFMNGLAIDPLMRDSSILCDFLTVENDADWNTKKASLSKMKSPEKITGLISTTGEIKTSISPEKEMYFTNIKDNALNNETLLKRMIDTYKLIINGMNEVSRLMAEVSTIWKALYENSEKYFEDKKATDSYNVMSKLMQDWSESEKRQADLISIDIKEYFRYIKNEFISMKDLISKVDVNRNTYKKAEEKLIWRKEDLFRRQDITKWELAEGEVQNKLKLFQDKDYAFSKMLPRDTAITLTAKYTYGYYLNRIIEEYERLRLLNGTRHSQKITAYCKKSSDILTDLHVGIADLVAFFAAEGNKGAPATTAEAKK